jgi:hypothetical protein
LRNRSLLDAATGHQLRFADAAQGGIFLEDGIRFIRLKDDTNLVARVPASRDSFTIKKNVPFTYWIETHMEDTLYVAHNADTVTKFLLTYHIGQSRSNIALSNYRGGIFKITGTSLYYALLHPFFFNAGSTIQLLASFENLVILIAFLIIFTGLIMNKKDALLPVAFLVLSILLCLLVGFATPNSGAIFRYRAPAVIFILMSALYYVPLTKFFLKRN